MAKDQRTELTLDFVTEQMKKDLKRIALGMLGPYVIVLICFVLSLLIVFGLGNDGLSDLYLLADWVFVLPFVIAHAVQLIKRIAMIRSGDFTVSTQEVQRIDRRFNLWYYLFSVERFFYPIWLLLIRASQPVMDFGRYDSVFVEQSTADYTRVGDNMHLIIYKGKIVAVYNARLYRRTDEA
ncbi:MAG: hypothetical protein IJW70_09655 [Clostridia bacterium]|nr:hypothetical protein [Clostridia bacterium]